MNLKNSGDSTGFEPMTSAMPVQCSNQLSYEVTQWRAGQLCSSVLVTFKQWLVLRNKLNHTHTNVAAKVQLHQPSLLIVFPSQILK